MLKLVFPYKIAGIVLVLLALSSCRKEINHELGTTISNEAPGWERISFSVVENLFALQVYNNRLYVGGEYGSQDNGYYGFLLSYNSADSAFTATNSGSYMQGGVYDLLVRDGDLFVAGDFKMFSAPFDLLSLYRMNQFGLMYDINFVNFEPMTIYHIADFGDSLLVAGSFNYQNFYAPNIVTSNVEFMQGNTHIGTASMSMPIHGSCVVNDELYICGEQGFFGYYSGTNFFSIDYPNKSFSDVVYDSKTIGTTVYLLGDFQDGSVIKAYNTSSGSWSNSSGLQCTTNLEHGARFRWINGELYVCGNDLMKGEDVTNIFKSSNGTNWKPVGTLTESARDIAFYDGVYYAATEIGLFRLND